MSNETEYTAGPWKAVPTAFGPIDIVISDGRDIVTVYGGGTGNKEANARLIAAAPELLDALMAVEMARHTDAEADWIKASALSEAAIVKATVKTP